MHINNLKCTIEFYSIQFFFQLQYIFVLTNNNACIKEVIVNYIFIFISKSVIVFSKLYNEEGFNSIFVENILTMNKKSYIE